jgi:hypothetical protein
MATNILSNPSPDSLKFQTSDLLYFIAIAFFILTMSLVCWITGLATLPILLETSIIALVVVVVAILCRVFSGCLYSQEELERQMRSATYIGDRLEWLKEAAKSLFPPGKGELGWSDEEEEITDGGSEKTVGEEEDLPTKDDSRDGDYKYESLS